MNNERYLEPPDEPEAEICEDCGQEMTEIPGNYRAGMPYFKCVNQFCPAKFADLLGNGVVLEMSQKLVEVSDDLATSQSALDVVRKHRAWLQEKLDKKEDEIASLERQIIEYQRILTLGQDRQAVSKIIERMEDAIDWVYVESEQGTDLSRISTVWDEVKKLLTNL